MKRKIPKYIEMQIQSQIYCFNKTKANLFIFLLENNEILKYFSKTIKKDYNFVINNMKFFGNYCIKYIMIPKILDLKTQEIESLNNFDIRNLLKKFEDCLKEFKTKPLDSKEFYK